MKRMISAVALLALVGAASLSADQVREATTRVFVTIDPNVAVSATQPIWDLGFAQTGTISATLIWRVDANSQFVNLQFAASPLFKADDPTSTVVAPIPLNVNSRLLVQPVNGNEAAAGDNLLEWDGQTTIGAYPATQTVIGLFESSQNGHFSQNVSTRHSYTQNDPEKPQGQYSGVARLRVLIPSDGQ